MLKYSFQQARLEDFTVMTQSKSFGRQQGHPKRRYPTANTTLRHNPEDGDNKVIRNVGILPPTLHCVTILKMETTRSSETSVSCRTTTLRYNRDDLDSNSCQYSSALLLSRHISFSYIKWGVWTLITHRKLKI